MAKIRAYLRESKPNQFTMKSNQVTNLQVSKALKESARRLVLGADSRGNSKLNDPYCCCGAIGMGMFDTRGMVNRYFTRVFARDAVKFNEGSLFAYWYSAKVGDTEDKRVSRTLGLLLASELAKEGLFCKGLGIKVVKKKKRPSKHALKYAKVFRLAAELQASVHFSGCCASIGRARNGLESYVDASRFFFEIFGRSAVKYNHGYLAFWYGSLMDRGCREARIMGLLLAAELLEDGQFGELVN